MIFNLYKQTQHKPLVGYGFSLQKKQGENTMNLKKYRAVFAALALSYLPLSAQADNSPDTLIAVAATANSVNAKISPAISKASHFLLFDHNGRFLRGIKAQSPATDSLIKQGVTVIVAQEFNRKQLDSLTSEGIIPIHKAGQAGNVIKDFLRCEEKPNSKNSQ